MLHTHRVFLTISGSSVGLLLALLLQKSQCSSAAAYTYDNVVRVYAGADETITALTHDGIKEQKDDAHTRHGHVFLEDSVDDAELVARIKSKSPW